MSLPTRLSRQRWAAGLGEVTTEPSKHHHRAASNLPALLDRVGRALAFFDRGLVSGDEFLPIRLPGIQDPVRRLSLFVAASPSAELHQNRHQIEALGGQPVDEPTTIIGVSFASDDPRVLELGQPVGTFSGVEVQYLDTERELGVILEVFSHLPEGIEQPVG